MVVNSQRKNVKLPTNVCILMSIIWVNENVRSVIAQISKGCFRNCGIIALQPLVAAGIFDKSPIVACI